jgi:hypothetical protein
MRLLAPQGNRQSSRRAVSLSRLISWGSQFLVCCGLLLQLKATGSEHPAAAIQEITSPMKFLHWEIPHAAPVSAFVHVNVIPMDREQTLRNQTVVIRSGHIVAIGTTGDIPLPPDAVLIDGTDKYLIPGLIDMHVRIYSPGELLLYVANGITMVRNIDGRPQHLSWRNKINDCKMLGPIIYTTGPTISAAPTAAEAKRIEMEQHRAGYDAVEAGDNLSAEAFHGITAVARALGVSVFGGVNTSVGLKGTVAGPQFFSLEQSEQFSKVVFKDDLNTTDTAISGAAAEIRSAKVWFAPTLVSFGNVVQQVEDLPRLLSQPGIQFLPPWTQKEWRLRHNYYQKDLGAEKVPLFRETWAFHKKIVSTMHREGVPIILGTDSMTVGTVPGFSVQQELANLVETGFTPFEALQTATKNASEWFVHPEGGGVFGTVTLRERADLVLLDANPLVDIRNVSRIRGVMVQGRWLPESDLHRMLAALPLAYSEEEKFLSSTVQGQPGSASKYLQENDPYHKLTNELLVNLVIRKGVRALKQVYAGLKQNDPTSIMIEETTVNDLGYQLLDLNRTSDAVEVFGINMRAHPTSVRAYDSLARAYLGNGNRIEAIRYLKEALRVDPSFQPARRALDQLESKEEQK